MFEIKRVNPQFILIRVDRHVQAAKREKIGKLFIPPGLINMQYNLQKGEILMIGDKIKELMPEMEPGDELLFHHSVEGNVTTEKKYASVLNWCIFDNEYSNDPDNLYYVVREDYMYGFRKKESQEVIMHPEFCLAIASAEETDSRNLKQVGSLLLFENFKEERDDIQRRLEIMKQECVTHVHRAPIIMQEMEALTRSLNKRRSATFMPVFIGWKIRRDFGAAGPGLDTSWMFHYEIIGSKKTVPQVTTIEVDNLIFYVLRSNYILFAHKPKKMVSRTLSIDDIIRENARFAAEERKNKFAGDARLAPGILSSN